MICNPSTRGDDGLPATSLSLPRADPGSHLQGTSHALRRGRGPCHFSDGSRVRISTSMALLSMRQGAAMPSRDSPPHGVAGASSAPQGAASARLSRLIFGGCPDVPLLPPRALFSAGPCMLFPRCDLTPTAHLPAGLTHLAGCAQVLPAQGLPSALAAFATYTEAQSSLLLCVFSFCCELTKDRKFVSHFVAT